MENYRILNLRAENVKRLKVVDITPDPSQNIITITGRNGQGKTSVLDSIFWALAGQKHIQEQPIRKGEERAEVKLDLGAYKVKRSFTAKGSYITVENADGFKSSSPQEMLNKLLGAITFDPLEFTRQDSKQQYDALRALVKLDVDLEALDNFSKADFDERTIVNRQIKDLEAQAAGIIVPDDTPDEPVIIAELVNQRDVLTGYIAQAEKVDRDISRLNLESLNIGGQITELENRIKELNARRDAIADETDTLQSQKRQIPVPADSEVNDLTVKIQNAETINGQVQQKKLRDDKLAELAKKQTESERLTAAIEERKQQKVDALARAEMPIKGLTFEDGKVIYNGVPFNQASNAEQIKVSTAIAMAMNPKLRVIRIKDGSLLDDDSMETLRTMAAENNFQVWIERVGDNDPIAVVIEDGQVKGAESEAA